MYFERSLSQTFRIVPNSLLEINPDPKLVNPKTIRDYHKILITNLFKFGGQLKRIVTQNLT